MTKEEFKAKAKEIIDSEQFCCMELFDCEEFEQMRLVQVDDWGESESSMPFIDFIDEFYEQIKGDLK